jgi:hypothetical protein
MRGIAGGWQISGITRFQSGAPLRLATSHGRCTAGRPCSDNLNLNFGADITGGGDGWRAVMSANPAMPKSDRTIDRSFNTSVF